VILELHLTLEFARFILVSKCGGETMTTYFRSVRPHVRVRADSTIKITLAGGSHHREVFDLLKEGDILRLVKEPSNRYDPMAIRFETEGGRLAGYVANSPKTLGPEASSAADIYDRIQDGSTAIIVHKLDFRATAIVNFDNEYLMKFLGEVPSDEIELTNPFA
jgi:hypothetical protein